MRNLRNAWLLLGAGLFLCTGCNLLPNSDELSERFSSFEVFAESSANAIVLIQAELNETPEETDLSSSTGATLVGIGGISPSAGPIGTEHTLYVNVSEPYAEQIVRVEAWVQTDGRGDEFFALEQDSAEPGAWRLNMTSSGATGEERADEIHYTLYYDTKAE